MDANHFFLHFKCPQQHTRSQQSACTGHQNHPAHSPVTIEIDDHRADFSVPSPFLQRFLHDMGVQFQQFWSLIQQG